MKIIVDTLPIQANDCTFSLYAKTLPSCEDKAICKLKINHSRQLEWATANQWSTFYRCELCDLENNKPCKHLVALNQSRGGK